MRGGDESSRQLSACFSWPCKGARFTCALHYTLHEPVTDKATDCHLQSEQTYTYTRTTCCKLVSRMQKTFSSVFTSMAHEWLAGNDVLGCLINEWAWQILAKLLSDVLFRVDTTGSPIASTSSCRSLQNFLLPEVLDSYSQYCMHMPLL